MEIGKTFQDTYDQNVLNAETGQEKISREALNKLDSRLGDDKLESAGSLHGRFSELTNEEAEKRFEQRIGDDKIDSLFPSEIKNAENSLKETRDLTDEEKQYFKSRLGWPEDRFDKCTIDEDGVLHYRTDRCDLEGKTAENGVCYERKRIEINGVQIEGVFPVFDSVFDMQLPEDKYKSNTYAKECNAKLKEEIHKNPELREKFTKEQLDDIENGRTPEGYVWHHNEEPGKMQLVKREDHDRSIGGAAHTGGNILWGPDSVDRSGKGENF